MVISTCNGFTIFQPETGGKAGKGCNKTGSIQLRQTGRNNMIVKQFRYVVDKPGSRAAAVQKAIAYATSPPK